MMKALLRATAITAGIALLAAPGVLVSILLGSVLDTSAGLAVARLADAALLSLGVTCWLGSGDRESHAVIGTVAAMLLYNLVVVVLLLLLRYYAGMTGMGLLPVSALHAALAVWCITCLRAAWSRGVLGSDGHLR